MRLCHKCNKAPIDKHKKYCDDCRREAYLEAKRQATARWYAKNPAKMCKRCGTDTVGFRKAYCDTCIVLNRKEQDKRHKDKYRKSKPKIEKTKVYTIDDVVFVTQVETKEKSFGIDPKYLVRGKISGVDK